jgi:hypothetical protein
MVYFLIFVTVLMHLVLPVVFIFWIYNAKAESKLFFFSIVLLYTSYLVFLWLLGAGWGWFGVFWPKIFAIAFGLALFLRVKKGLPANWTVKRWSRPFFSIGLNLVLSAIFLAYILTFLNARDFEGEALELEFPLTNGTFFIAHGGANKNINNHFPVKAQRYALDIMELNSFGTRAGGLLPDEPESYQIFGNDIVAPCTGEVIATRADLKDQNAMVFDPENLLGNHIILFCQGNSILLAHLKHESVLVNVGDFVKARQLLAQVGNTGNTSEPHLHIHAVLGRHIEKDGIALTGPGVAMTFGGRFLIRGDKIEN